MVSMSPRGRLGVRWTVIGAAFVAAAVLMAPSGLAQGRAAGAAGQAVGGQGRGQGGGGGRGQAGGGFGRGQQARDNTQQQTIGTGSIAGTVVSEVSGGPVRRARVTLSGAELRGGRSVVTDDQGAFSFTAVPAGRFTMTASKAGYVDVQYGANRPGRPGTPIQLADGQKVEKANISLPKGSVVTGVVLDENGEPAPGTQVRVLKYVMRTGEKTLQPSGQDQTDDRGMYRVYGLQPGDYIVSAIPRNFGLDNLRQTITNEIQALLQEAGVAGAGGRGGRGGADPTAGMAGLLGRGGGSAQNLIDRASQLQQQLAESDQQQTVAYAPVYYPGTPVASGASTVTLAIGEERAGIDFQLQLVPTARVEGTVVSPDGTLPPGTQITLLPAGQEGLPLVPGVGMNMARTTPEGRFSFQSVTPGQYRLMARAVVRDPNADPAAGGRGGRGGFGGLGGRGGAPAEVLWASTDVSVGGQNVDNVVLSLQRGMTVSGRIVFEGSAAQPPTDLTRVRVSLAARGQQIFTVGGVPPAQVDETGRFTITGVAPGTYTISANAPGGGGRGAAPNQPAGQWTLKSAIVGGSDALDIPFEVHPNEDLPGVVVTFNDRQQQLSGMIQDAQGRPTSDFTIIVFPSDTRYWLPQARRIASTRPGTDGKFSFRNLPSGDYRLTAVTDVEPGEWYDPTFLGQLGGVSIPITLAEGESKVQDIRLAGGGTR